MKRAAHVSPEGIALWRCEAEVGTCRCAELAREQGRRAGQRIRRRLCEDRYRQAIAKIIETVLPGALNG